MKARSFRESLYQRLQDPEFAVAYFNDAIEDSNEEFQAALGHVVKARGGVARVMGNANLSREAAYRMLSTTGNPEFRSIRKILEAKGLRITFGILGDVEREPTTKTSQADEAENTPIGIS